MKKTVFTLDIGNYLPEMTRYTFPFMQYWADKIGADFKIIKENKFPDYCPSYNKFQIYELGKDNDFNIFVDADTFIHPHFIDLTMFLNFDEVFFTAKDFAPVRFFMDEVFKLDRRGIGACSWFIAAGKAAHNLWEPSEFSPEELNTKIYPTQDELKNIRIKPEHLQDDFTFSRNIAKHHLKHCTYEDLQNNGRIFEKVAVYEYLLHNYSWTSAQKIAIIQEHVQKQQCVKWNIDQNKLVPIIEEEPK